MHQYWPRLLRTSFEVLAPIKKWESIWTGNQNRVLGSNPYWRIWNYFSKYDLLLTQSHHLIFKFPDSILIPFSALPPINSIPQINLLALLMRFFFMKERSCFDRPPLPLEIKALTPINPSTLITPYSGKRLYSNKPSYSINARFHFTSRTVSQSSLNSAAVCKLWCYCLFHFNHRYYRFYLLLSYHDHFHYCYMTLSENYFIVTGWE